MTHSLPKRTGADLSKYDGEQTLYPTNSIPSAQELVGLIESFIEGKIEEKFAYFLDHDDLTRQHYAEEGLEILRKELVNKLTEGINLPTEDSKPASGEFKAQ